MKSSFRCAAFIKNDCMYGGMQDFGKAGLGEEGKGSLRKGGCAGVGEDGGGLCMVTGIGSITWSICIHIRDLFTLFIWHL